MSSSLEVLLPSECFFIVIPLIFTKTFVCFAVGKTTLVLGEEFIFWTTLVLGEEFIFWTSLVSSVVFFDFLLCFFFFFISVSSSSFFENSAITIFLRLSDFSLIRVVIRGSDSCSKAERNLQSYLSTTRVRKLTVVFEYYEAKEIYSRIWALRG